MSKLVIKNINLIDGEGNEPKNTAILIENGVFKSIGDINESDAEIIDGQGRYMLPGMIDSHVHLAIENQPMAEKVSTPFSYNFFKSIQYAENTINAGVTTVRDAYGADLGFKRAIEDKIVKGPRMKISVSALSITGGHADPYNYSGIRLPLVPTYPGMPDPIADGKEEVRKKVREVLRAGADIIKIMATGGVSTPTDHPKFTQFSKEELDVIVEEAEFRNGLKVMAHAQGAEGIEQCIDAGIHSIEHGIYLTDELVEKMVENGTYLVPTLLAPLSVLEFSDELGMSDVAIEKSKEVMEVHLESFRKAYNAGVKIAMGTDAGVFKHGTNLRELELMVNNGMSPMESIVSSTKTAAECLGYDNLGVIKENYLADFILVNENPLDNIGMLKDNNNIVVVAKDGEILKDLR